MKKIIFTFLVFITVLSTVDAQKGVNFHGSYAAGGRMLMNLDSSAKNVFYSLVFPNQPNVAFNYLPEVHHVSVKYYFRKAEHPENFRYSIVVDDTAIAVNKSIDITQLEDDDIGDEEIYRTTNFGVFPVKNKTITIIIYDIKKPQDIQKNIFYGKRIPRPKIKYISKRFKTDKGVDYSYITKLKDKINLVFTEKDDEITIYKDRSNLDFLYSITIRNKQTKDTIFESNTWQSGGMSDGTGYLPEVRIDRSNFKKSGDYEVIIQPSIRWRNCRDCDLSAKEIEKSIARYTLAITLEEGNYTKREVIKYIIIVALSIGLFFLVVLYFIKKRSKQKLAEKEQQRNTAKLQLNSVRSQLNPHFLFNALSGIQNLMNKNEIDNANKYLSKFARLTRNVLDDKELISLSQEKTLLDDYLQMEQLRFGFKYEINYSENLDLKNIEIPSMLLQPFVENAVKHGISQKGTEGKILIAFGKQAKDLVLTVTDNGNGFDIENKNEGLGLPLSYSRIELLNSIYKENRFTLDIQSAVTGTNISLTLTDWL